LSGETVAVREGSTVYAAVGDHLGSVTVLAQGGSVAGATRYLPYGAIRWESGLWSTDRRFTGQRWEASLGLYDYKARFYDPTLGRFLQPDPIVPEPGDPRALNRYAYVYNNPLRYTDPSGHWLETAWDILNIGWDLYEVYRDPRNAWNWVALAADVGAAILPAVPGGVGLVVRGGRAAKAGIELATHVDEAADVGRIVAEAASHADEAADALRAGKEVAQEVVEVASRSGRPPIVIGENMAERVIPYAQQIGAQTINDFIPAERWSMEANEAWIRQMRAEGREIIDIGPHFRRRLDRALDGIRPDSEAYNMERRVLQGYEGYRKVFQRSGKYWGGVPGLDWR
jgi:RHS repeat-associated protein